MRGLLSLLLELARALRSMSDSNLAAHDAILARLDAQSTLVADLVKEQGARVAIMAEARGGARVLSMAAVIVSVATSLLMSIVTWVAVRAFDQQESDRRANVTQDMRLEAMATRIDAIAENQRRVLDSLGLGAKAIKP